MNGLSLWPDRGICPGCGRRGDGGFCRGCLTRIPLVVAPWCPRCGRPLRLGAGTDAPEDCPDCARGLPQFRVARSAGLYDGALRDYLHRFKFGGDVGLAPALARLMSQVWRRCPELRSAEVVVPVPVAPARLATRGFNQAALLADYFRVSVGRPLVNDALACDPRPMGAQSLLGRREREAHRRHAYQVYRGGNISGRRVLLIDDIITTGATASACAEALLRSGALRVDVLAVACVPLAPRPR